MGGKTRKTTGTNDAGKQRYRVEMIERSAFVFIQVVERKKTPAEIREEYERLQRERDERRLQQRTNPKVGP